MITRVTTVNDLLIDDRWKLGQINPGSTIEFRRVSWKEAVRLNDAPNKWLSNLKALVARPDPRAIGYSPYTVDLQDSRQLPILHIEGSGKKQVIFRQVGSTLYWCSLPRHLSSFIGGRFFHSG
jgi:urea carboxylase